jgi:DNA polymerase delta subunit 3
MLFEFHKWQNSLSPGTIHATYIVYGRKIQVSTQEDGDVEMGSSMPEAEELSERVLTFTLTLVQEEKLKGE